MSNHPDRYQGPSKSEKKLIATINALPHAPYPFNSFQEELAHWLNIAAQIELATIPIYLYTYYSINRLPDKDKPGSKTTDKPWALFANEAGATIMSVAVEEMLHMSLSSNIYYALTGKPPELYGNSPPPPKRSYPSPLPEHAQTGPFGGQAVFPLSKFSYQQLKKFLVIEWPEQRDAAPETTNWETLGQLYSTLRCLIWSDKISDDDFKYPEAKQFQAEYYAPNNVDTVHPTGSFEKNCPPSHGESAAKKASYENSPESHVETKDPKTRDELITISSKTDAIVAIETICDQGEGYDQEKTDGGDEESHFYKFLSLQSRLKGYFKDNEEWDQLTSIKPGPPPVPKRQYSDSELAQLFVYPFPDNPTTADYAAVDPVIEKISDACNALYGYMLIMSETTQKVEGHEQKMFFNTGMHNSMIWLLDKVIQAMRNIPVTLGGSGYVVAPTFEFIDLGSRHDGYAGSLEKLKSYASAAKEAIGDSKNYSDVSYYMQKIIDPSQSTSPPLPDVSKYW